MSTANECKPVDILLVEDNEGDARLTTEALEDSKVPTPSTTCATGRRPSPSCASRGRYAGAPTPDIILLDLNLPRKNGREVLQDIKSDPALKHIPVVVLTISSDEEDILRAYRPARELLHHQAHQPGPVPRGRPVG